MGADASSSFFYMKTKGEIDEKVKSFKFERSSVFRPGLLLTERSESRPSEYAFQSVMGVLNFMFVGPLAKYQAIKVETVARSMRLDFEEYFLKDQKGHKIYDNDEIYEKAYKDNSKL